ncbi:MAG: hypothetical protein ABI988_12195, partial [Nitrospirota bacterium]
MARKKRLPYKCNDCGRRFKNAQSVRGHLLHCPAAKRRRQAEAQAEAQPETGGMQNNHRAHATEQSRSSLDRTVADEKRRAGPLGREFRVLVLSVQDLLEHLQDDAHEFAVQADCFADMSVRGAHEKYLAWREMYAILDDCLRDLDQMLPMFRLERVPLFGIYDRIRSLKKRWMKQRVAGFYRLALE